MLVHGEARLATLDALWLGTALGWALIAARLSVGLTGRARRAALAVHGLTPLAILLGCALIGLGSLYATIVLAAQWWALALVTRLRPERLTDPAGNGLGMLAGWLAATALLIFALHSVIFPR